jgi:hypothetical protein
MKNMQGHTGQEWSNLSVSAWRRMTTPLTYRARRAAIAGSLAMALSVLTLAVVVLPVSASSPGATALTLKNASIVDSTTALSSKNNAHGVANKVSFASSRKSRQPATVTQHPRQRLPATNANQPGHSDEFIVDTDNDDQYSALYYHDDRDAAGNAAGGHQDLKPER